jgi:TolB-like protein/DNA-binding winged helix-turn-helix (wHTH) protein/tetratricopeptide (TPR) repeat protein
LKPANSTALRIGDWRVDPAVDEISRDGALVKLEPRAMRLLLCLAEHVGNVVSVHQLLDEVWADVVVTSDSVYQAVAALRRTLGDDAKEPTYIATLPRRGYRLIAAVGPWNESANAVSLASPLTPVAEFPGGTRPVAAARLPVKWYRWLLLVGLALFAGYFVVRQIWQARHHIAAVPANIAARTSIADKSIAVLPFVDMSESQDQEYFADGMAEEVTDLLAKVPGIRVIGRTSSFQFKGKGEDLRTIGSMLGASYLVEGSVRKSGDRLRVAAQLVGAQDGSHLWSETYDETTGDVLKIQDRIAAGLVRALQVTVGADDLQAPAILKSTEAYDLYLRGRHALDRWDRIGFEAAAGYFQQTLDLDPTAVRAAEWLAVAQSNLAVWSFVPPQEGFERARRSAQHALTLNPRSGLAHSVLASTDAIYDWDWAAAERESQQALTLEPRNAFVIGNVGFARSAYTQPEESARLMSEAVALDPLCATWHELLGQMRYRAGRLNEAEAELHKVLDFSPSYAEGYYFLGQILLAEGKSEAALVVMGRETPENGRDTGLAIAYHALGRGAESDTALARQIKEHASDSAYEVAQAHAYRAERDEAFAWLDRAYRQKDVELYWVKGDPLLKNLEGDPRYQAFLRKMKLPE